MNMSLRDTSWLGVLGCLVGLAGVSTGVAGEALLLQDGSRTEAAAFVFDGTLFRPGAGAPTPAAAASPVPRNTVTDWFLSAAAPAAGQAATGSAAAVAGKTATSVANPAVAATLQGYRQEAERLAQQFPGCKGVQVLDEGTYRLTADHRHLYRYHFVGLVLNEEMQAWGNLSLGFTEGRSRVNVTLARCLTADGRVLELDPKELTTGKSGGHGDVFFDPNARQVTGNIPGVEVGSLVEYEFEYDTYAPEDWHIFFPTFYFRGDLPVNHSIFHVEVPAGMRLYSWEENWVPARGWLSYTLPWHWWPASRPFTLTHVRDGAAGVAYDVYSWAKHEVPPIAQEPEMPPWNEIAPAVYATILGDWEHLNTLIGGMQKERLTVTPAVQAKVTELTAGLSTSEAKAAVLYHWVQKNIRYISIKSSLSSGWSGHPATETLANGYGDCTDKSNLLATMLRAVGIDAEPVVLRTNDAGLFVPRYPMIHANHCITEVHLGGQDFFLDSTTQDHRYPALRADDHGVVTYNFMRGWRKEVTVPPGMAAHGKVATDELALQADGTLRVASRNVYTGNYESGLRGGWKQVPDALRQQVMQQFLNSIAPGAKLGEFKLPDPQDLNIPFTLEYAYLLPAYVVPAGNLRLFQFPERERKFPEVSLETRQYPVSYTTSEAIDRHVTLQLPPELRVVELPAAVQIHTDYVTYTEAYAIQGATITADFHFERHGRRVPVADYAGYRRTLGEIERITKRPLYLETATGK